MAKRAGKRQGCTLPQPTLGNSKNSGSEMEPCDRMCGDRCMSRSVNTQLPCACTKQQQGCRSQSHTQLNFHNVLKALKR